MVKELRFPRRVVLDNESTMSGEEIMLRGLYEIVTGENQECIGMHVFGRDQSAQSRAFKWLNEHMYNEHHVLVHDNLAWFFRNGLVAQSAEAIGAKLDTNNENLVAFMIDFNLVLPEGIVQHYINQTDFV